MKVQVCFTIDQEQWAAAVRRLAELTDGAELDVSLDGIYEEELKPLLAAIQSPECTVFEEDDE